MRTLALVKQKSLADFEVGISLECSRLSLVDAWEWGIRMYKLRDTEWEVDSVLVKPGKHSSGQRTGSSTTGKRGGQFFEAMT